MRPDVLYLRDIVEAAEAIGRFITGISRKDSMEDELRQAGVLQKLIVIEPDEDAYHAYVPALPGCHTFGQTVKEAQANIKEAIELHIECMKKDGNLPSAV